MARDDNGSQVPLLAIKHADSPSVFVPENLLREARRQRGLPEAKVPRVCLLDPDGDIVRYLRATGAGVKDPAWACYHTDMLRTARPGGDLGIVGCAVGAPFAVLVAEQMFASGCELLISITSAGQLIDRRPPPYFLLIERALRDEGTSYHYAAAGRYSALDSHIAQRLDGAFSGLAINVVNGASWTTDAPYRETAEAIEAMRAEGLEAVEMEAAALYAFAAARGRSVVCFAHITNRMAKDGDDFEKGEADGAIASLMLVDAVMRTLA
jgi:uridine phosphorylase